MGAQGTWSAPRGGDLPLAVRNRLARPSALVVLATAVVALVLVVLVPRTAPLAPSTAALRTLALVPVLWVLTDARLQRWLGLRGRPSLLVAQALLYNGMVLVWAAAPGAEARALSMLPVAMLLSSALLDLRSLVAVVGVTCGAAVVLLAPTVPAEVTWAVVAGVLAATIGALTSRGVAAALRAADEEREATERARAALGVVVAAAAATPQPEQQGVLDAVVDASATIGGGVAAVYLRDRDGTVRRGPVRGGVTAPDDVPPHLVARVLRAGAARQLTPAASDPCPFTIGACRHATGVPVRVGAEVDGVLVAASPELLDDQAVDALQLLADHAGRSLRLSQRIDADARDIEQLREHNAEQDAFVAIVAHELRSPVTVLDGLVHTLAEHEGQIDATRRQVLVERLRANTTSLRDIVTSLLDDARLARGQEAARERVDLSTMVMASVDRLSPLLTDHDVRLHVAAGGFVAADGALLQRVVDNLVSNAREHTPAGSRVEVAVVVDDGTVTVAVSDDGPGIPADVLPTLTTRFARAAVPGTAHRGLGIGLALVSRILELHGATLQVGPAAEDGTGARFAFSLPALARTVQSDDLLPSAARQP